nr:hypothetical protein [Hankyongella ginsenosidimutans]
MQQHQKAFEREHHELRVVAGGVGETAIIDDIGDLPGPALDEVIFASVEDVVNSGDRVQCLLDGSAVVQACLHQIGRSDQQRPLRNPQRLVASAHADIFTEPEICR